MDFAEKNCYNTRREVPQYFVFFIYKVITK
ncbi:MAG: hypothetical protein H6Q49_1842 [Deltaproteobacteria bacterium]|nr:hypothetical protein [Deltaproteobacteria bacterium]